MVSENLIESQLLKTCDIPVQHFKMEPFVMVIFGGAGDLSRRMLIPTLYQIHQQGELPSTAEIIGVGLPEMSSEQYRELMQGAVKEFESAAFASQDWQTFENHLSFISGDFENEATYQRLLSRIEALGSKHGDNIIYYLAVPSGFFDNIIKHLDKLKMCKGRFNTKVIVEKPFGRDLASAIELNRSLLGVFDENQIYRIDHFLGKETVQNILFLRFANPIFEQMWNSLYIDNVQITVSEEMGIEKRGHFYEQTGIVRDMFQNHVLQIASLIAMEPPIAFVADTIRDEKVKLFRSIRPLDDRNVDESTVRGQYGPGLINGKKVPGYRQEDDVAPESETPTFFAGKLFIDNWRWAGVPFYIRTGKRMAKHLTQISILFKQLPLKLFGSKREGLEPNILHLTIEPQEKISLHFGVKYPFSPNQIYATDLLFSYSETFNLEQHPPYQKLLVDCMKGDLTLFVRQDGVEAMWEIVDSINARWESLPPVDFPNYAAGAWGPEAADLLLERDGRKWVQ